METLINYAGLLAGLLLAIYGIILQVRSNRKKEPVFSIKSVNVISEYKSRFANLDVAYDGQLVESFTVSKILFYNRGAETITNDDINTINHLTICPRRGQLLDASILQANNVSNNFHVKYVLGDTPEDHRVSIEFDYLDRNQGAVIQLAHTGLSSADVEIVGDIKGVEKLKEIPAERMRVSGKPMTKGDQQLVWSLFIFVLVGLGFFFFGRAYNGPLAGILWFLAIMSIVLSPAALLLGVMILGGLIRSSRAIPLGLDQFRE